MRTVSLSRIAIAAVLASGVLAGCGAPARMTTSLQPHAAAAADDRLNLPAAAIATDILGLDFQGDVRKGSGKNVSGLSSRTTMFSSRTDSRTYFAYDRRFSQTVEYRGDTSSDDKVLSDGRALLAKLKIPAAEIASSNLLRESQQSGRLDPKTRKIVTRPVTRGKGYAYFTRAVDGIPVFSSRAMIGFTQTGRLGYMEVHWPLIPDAKLSTAHQLAERVRGGWQPPALKGARPETIAAGIIHSPAAAQVMDIVPAIRVIYANLDPRIGLKPVRYFDGDGKEVASPRISAQTPPAGHPGIRKKGYDRPTR